MGDDRLDVVVVDVEVLVDREASFRPTKVEVPEPGPHGRRHPEIPIRAPQQDRRLLEDELQPRLALGQLFLDGLPGGHGLRLDLLGLHEALPVPRLHDMFLDDGRQQLVVPRRLHDVRLGSGLHRLERRLFAPERDDEDDRRAREATAESAQELDAVAIAQLASDDDRVKMVGQRELQPLFP